MFDSLPDPNAAPPLQQSQAFENALETIGRRTSRIGGCLWLHRKILRGIPVSATLRAPILPGFETVVPSGRALVILSPERPAPWLSDIGALALMTPAHVAEWHLNPDHDALRARLQQKWRNRLNASERAGLLVERQLMPLKADHWLLQADQKLSRTRGYRNWPPALTLAFAAAERRAAQLFTASYKGEILAAILVLRHGAAATYHIGHITDDGRCLSAHNLLLWRAATWLSNTGCTRFDLGQIDTTRTAGLARFKLGTGARLRPLGGTWGIWAPMGRMLRPLASLDRRAMTA